MASTIEVAPSDKLLAAKVFDLFGQSGSTALCDLAERTIAEHLLPERVHNRETLRQFEHELRNARQAALSKTELLRMQGELFTRLGQMIAGFRAVAAGLDGLSAPEWDLKANVYRLVADRMEHVLHNGTVDVNWQAVE